MPGEQETIAKIRQMRREGATFDAIAQSLNAQGIAPRTASRAGKRTKWHGAAVQRILNRAESSSRTRHASC